MLNLSNTSDRCQPREGHEQMSSFRYSLDRLRIIPPPDPYMCLLTSRRKIHTHSPGRHPFVSSQVRKKPLLYKKSEHNLNFGTTHTWQRQWNIKRSCAAIATYCHMIQDHMLTPYDHIRLQLSVEYEVGLRYLI